MNGTLRVKDEPVRVVEGILLRGSDYPIAYATGARVELLLDPSTAQVVVTRGRGLVKLAYLEGPGVTSIARGLKQGYRFTGQIAAVGIGPSGKVLHIALDRPQRG